MLLGKSATPPHACVVNGCGELGRCIHLLLPWSAAAVGPHEESMVCTSLVLLQDGDSGAGARQQERTGWSNTAVTEASSIPSCCAG
jgi:hypothetical protein